MTQYYIDHYLLIIQDPGAMELTADASAMLHYFQLRAPHRLHGGDIIHV